MTVAQMSHGQPGSSLTLILCDMIPLQPSFKKVLTMAQMNFYGTLGLNLGVEAALDYELLEAPGVVTGFKHPSKYFVWIWNARVLLQLPTTLTAGPFN